MIRLLVLATLLAAGLPVGAGTDATRVADQYSLRKFKGTHGIGHTRMATESAVTTMGAHPFSTGSDQCLVHNGSLSNPYEIRRMLEPRGIAFETDYPHADSTFPNTEKVATEICAKAGACGKYPQQTPRMAFNGNGHLIRV